MKDKIREICYDLEIGCIDWTEASEQLFALCDVSQHRELLVSWEKRRYSLEDWKIVEKNSIEFIDDWLSN